MVRSCTYENTTGNRSRDAGTSSVGSEILEWICSILEKSRENLLKILLCERVRHTLDTMERGAVLSDEASIMWSKSS